VTEEIRLDGVGVAPGVLETIATLATEALEGVDGIIGIQGFAGLVQKGANRPISVIAADDGTLSVAVHVRALYGSPLKEIAHGIQRSVADALRSQTGHPVGTVDVFIDDIAFSDQ
jgi:uncharacterized alkaline shock family protein YloU